jgi:hypothetical protein
MSVCIPQFALLLYDIPHDTTLEPLHHSCEQTESNDLLRARIGIELNLNMMYTEEDLKALIKQVFQKNIPDIQD